MARKMGKSGNVEAIRKCRMLGRLLWIIDGRMGEDRDWDCRRRDVSMGFEIDE